MTKKMYLIFASLQMVLAVVIWFKFFKRWQISQDNGALVQGGMALMITLGALVLLYLSFKNVSKK